MIDQMEAEQDSVTPSEVLKEKHHEAKCGVSVWQEIVLKKYLVAHLVRAAIDRCPSDSKSKRTKESRRIRAVLAEAEFEVENARHILAELMRVASEAEAALYHPLEDF